MNLTDWVWSVISLILTVMILSYLIGDNILFRFAASVFIGLTAGYGVIIIGWQILWPYLFRPMISSTWLEKIWLIIPILLILLLVVSQIKRFSWLGRFPLAYLGGLIATVTMGGAVFGTLIPQGREIIDAFDPQAWYEGGSQPWFRIADSIVMLFATIGTLSYFHFGRKWKTKPNSQPSSRPLILEGLSKLGQIFIGITLGTVFTGIFSSTLLALIDRLLSIGQFISNLFGGV